MIMDSILSLFTGLSNGAYGLLPTYNNAAVVSGLVPGDTNQYMDLAGGGQGGMSAVQAVFLDMWMYNNFIPMDHMVTIMGITILIWELQTALNGVKWAIGFVRGSGTSSGGGTP